MKIENRKSKIENFLAFTLIELLVVISIMGVLAGLTIPGLKAIKTAQYRKVARAELERVETALENYKAKYGTYPPDNNANPLMNQLYYELSGTTITKIGAADYFVTLDGSGQIPVASVSAEFGVGGFINCTPAGSEDAARAKNFLSGLKQNQMAVAPNTATVLITSVGGPDETYRPLGTAGLNPIRYVNPGTHNPNSYDLWVQLVISGKTNLICNWSKPVQINSPLP